MKQTDATSVAEHVHFTSEHEVSTKKARKKARRKTGMRYSIS